MRSVKRKRSNGFVLLLVVSLIPLIGVVSAVLLVNSRHLLVSVRMEELRLRAQMACRSGQDWALQNQTDIAALTADRPITLTIDERLTCVIDFVSRDGSGTTVTITGHAAHERFGSDYERQMFIHAP
jgi:hypothetical protein